jgi:hypothetical protein
MAKKDKAQRLAAIDRFMAALRGDEEAPLLLTESGDLIADTPEAEPLLAGVHDGAVEFELSLSEALIDRLWHGFLRVRGLPEDGLNLPPGTMEDFVRMCRGIERYVTEVVDLFKRIEAAGVRPVDAFHDPAYGDRLKTALVIGDLLALIQDGSLVVDVDAEGEPIYCSVTRSPSTRPRRRQRRR